MIVDVQLWSATKHANWIYISRTRSITISMLIGTCVPLWQIQTSVPTSRCCSAIAIVVPVLSMTLLSIACSVFRVVNVGKEALIRVGCSTVVINNRWRRHELVVVPLMVCCPRSSNNVIPYNFQVQRLVLQRMYVMIAR